MAHKSFTLKICLHYNSAHDSMVSSRILGLPPAPPPYIISGRQKYLEDSINKVYENFQSGHFLSHPLSLAETRHGRCWDYFCSSFIRCTYRFFLHELFLTQFRRMFREADIQSWKFKKKYFFPLDYWNQGWCKWLI